ncbi:MAG: cob(I)yrinic acid a,c-diamide adenosyltransferase [Candidatus Buchananbacteria bacterium]|nr:cob(I)yrinic acid a,c-diamide adenosyltransferase [Candidatus Buchananbacteria bacterium]
MKSDLGKVHVYTGDGKGKTTASLGLALRAIGAGYQVYIVQFLKGQDYSELTSLKPLKEITLKRFGQKSFIIKKAKPTDIALAKQGLAWARRVIKSKKFDVVILDEIFLAVFFKMLKVSDLVSLIKIKPKNVELILTGRRAPAAVVALADYVTEMKEVKHPYKKGVVARRGIEN